MVRKSSVLSRLVSRPTLGRGRSSRYKWILHLADEYTLDKKLRTAGMGNTKKRWYLLKEMKMARRVVVLVAFSVSLSVVPFIFLSIKCVFASVYWYLVAYYMKTDVLVSFSNMMYHKVISTRIELGDAIMHGIRDIFSILSC